MSLWCLAGVAASNEVFNALNPDKQLYLKTSGSFVILNLKYVCIAKIFNSLNKENVDKKLNYI